MKLDAYLSSENIKEADFAASIDCSQAHVNRLRRGKSFPSPKMIERIRRATGEQVSFADWYTDLRKAG